MTGRGLLRWTAALGLSAGGLWFALAGMDWAAFRASLAGIRSPGWLLIFLVTVPFEFLMRTVRWNVLFRPLGPATVGLFFPVTAAAFFLNNVLPFRAGEVARIYWSRQKTGAPVSSCVAVLAVDRVLDMMVLLTLVAWVLVGNGHWFPSSAPVWTFGLSASGGLAVMLVFARAPEAAGRWVDRLPIPGRLKGWARQFAQGAKALSRTRTLLGLYALSLGFWSVNVLLIQQMAGLFSMDLTWSAAAWVVIAFCLGALAPSAPGYVGTLEAAGVAALGALGYEKTQALPFVLVVHLMQILSTAVWGFPCLWAADLKVQRQPS
jgi:glycosyltransferase 2 family protein